MTVKSERLYWVVCDGCGEQPEDDWMRLVHPGRVAAEEDALGGDWYRVGRGRHACGNCVAWDGDGKAIFKSDDFGSVDRV